MKKLLLVAGMVLVGMGAQAANLVTGPDVFKTVQCAGISTITVDRAQEVWIPVGVAIDVGNGTETSTNTLSFLPTGGATPFRLQSIVMVGGAETNTSLSDYPALVYGDKLILAPDRTTTTNKFSVTLIKQVIPR
jgi:hypothetical protein